MSDPGESAREAAERNAAAVARGDLAQVMADLTPESLQKMMQLGSQGGVNPATLPNITGFQVEEMPPAAGGEVFRVTFTAETGSATLEATWKQVLAQWKIVDVAVIDVESAGEG